MDGEGGKAGALRSTGSGHLCTEQCLDLPACTHGNYNVRGDDSGRELGFCSSQCEKSVSSCQPRGQSQRNLAPGFLLASRLLYFGNFACQNLQYFSPSIRQEALFFQGYKVSWSEQQGEPRNQISDRALCTVVLLSSSAASASCKQAAQLMFDLPMACSLVGPVQQQQPWQTVLTPLGDRMPSPGILTPIPGGKHCPRNWYTPLCPGIWGRNLGS